MNGTDEERLLALAQAWADAIVANDVRAIGRYMTDDWVLVDQDGIGTREKFLSLVASGDLTHEMMRTVEGTARVRVYGDTAVLTARVVNTAHYRGQAFHADEWTTDVYLRTPTGWLCTHSHVTPAA
ncbi:nuclear transport factor 2 family protein [Streptomyces sp. DSM 42041]|uniref:Nuclear transport factor 2 family protein n=1 Tax=Streptomyces hazeniae TaxID=3075538 RepID=A0ABU2NMK4_9ACTN|nr:nuclear transport factor 2 family protein [Streptomyces sp. DSM 42041]MDT0377453.1 nuclear transport factor 2 family protein [Streptomyces sp. DSM 42041]